MWAAKRRLFILFLLAAIIGGLVAAVYFLIIFKPASCFDGRQNGLEEGIDCGGGCELVCPFAATEPNVIWTRAFPVGPGTYNLTALVENPNFDLRTTATYVFRAYNADNVLVAEVFGSVPLEPAETRPIFEPSVLTGQQTIARTFFEFTTNDGWLQQDQLDSPLVIKSRIMDKLDSQPTLTAQIENQHINPIRNIEVYAVLFDKKENIIQTSRTFIERIAASSIESAFFTWPEPFGAEVHKIDVYPIIQSR